MKTPDLAKLRNFFQDLQGLDPKDVGSWPLAVRIFVLTVWLAALLFAGFWFDTKSQQEELAKLKEQEAKLKGEFEKLASQAANLSVYEQQLVVMEQSFGAMLAQLPKEHEVDDLLEQVSQAGLGAGLEFKLFKLEPEKRQEFFAELPVRIEVHGDYHALGTFVSELAALPRIVTLHNIKVSGAKGSKGGGRDLSMEAIAKTYRYIEGGK